MRILFILLVACISVVSADAQRLKSGGPLKPEQANMDIRHYNISIAVDPVSQSISGSVTITLLLEKQAPVMIFDLAKEMVIKKITVNNRNASFTHENNEVFLRSENNFPAGKTAVKFEYAGKPVIAPRPPWVGGFQWSIDSSGHPWIAVSCQGEGGKIYFPCKDHPSDEPNEGADMIIAVPRGLVVAGPGLLQSKKNKKTQTVYHWKTRYPISNYCLVFNVGNYVVRTREYITVNNNRVPMEFYVLAEHADKAAHQLEMLEVSARVLEKYFGEYPWVKEKIAIAETPHLGMEHQTMNAYGNKFQYTQVGGKDFDWLMHHEFGHEWWANKISNQDWAHMWIQEGICAFGDALYTRELEGEKAYQVRMMQTGLSAQNKIPILQGEEGLDSEKVYHGDIYGKGAFFMHTLRFVMGDSLFFPAIRSFAMDSTYCCYNTVTTNMLDDYLSQIYGKKLTPLFDLYLRTIQKLEISVKQISPDQWLVRSLNLDMAVPIEIRTDQGLSKIPLDKQGVKIKSTQMPQIDPTMFYLRKVIFD